MNPFRPQDSASSTTASLSVKKVVDSTDLAYSGMDDFTFTVAMQHSIGPRMSAFRQGYRSWIEQINAVLLIRSGDMRMTGKEDVTSF